MKKSILALALSCLLLLSACSEPAENTGATGGGSGNSGSAGNQNQDTAVQGEPAAIGDLDVESLFSDRDYEVGYDPDNCAVITLTGASAQCGSNAVKIDGGTVTITDEGTYVLRGTLDDGMILVNADKQDKVQLVLDGANITSQTCAALYILQADKVFLTVSGENTLQNGGSFEAIGDNNIDGAIFSKEDLTMNGEGSLTVISPAGHGVVSKDELTVTSGTYTIQCAGHGLDGKDSVAIANAALTITAGKDGIHAENDDDAAMGYAYIASGSFVITAEGDGISAGSCMQIDGGSFHILCGGGAVNGEKQSSDNWGGMGGGRGGMGGGPGMGGHGGGGGMGSLEEDTEEDSTSIKGIKAGGELLIKDGSFVIDSADDAIHSNGAVTVCSGTFEIATGDDGFHADQALAVSGGTITVTESYEGLEGLSIAISGGDINLKSSDDGLNAAGGTDQSGFGGMRGGDKFGGMSGGSSDSFITISGGSLYINASGDGIDSNGTLEISDGFVTVCGPTQGDTAVLDYDTTGTITGGTFIGTGAYMMAQTFSDSEQGVIALSVGNQSAGTRVTLSDANGRQLIDYTPELSYAIVILSTPDMEKGQTYTVTVGDLSGEFEAS